MQREYQELNQNAGVRKPKKPVRYRARHKTLGHLKEEDTKHGFMERIRIQDSEGRASEPPRVGVFVMDNATDLQTIPLTQNNYRKASGKLEDHIKAQPTRRTRTLPSSSNTTRRPGIGPYSLPRRSRTDVREIRQSDPDPSPQYQVDMVQPLPQYTPYNTPSTGVPMSLPNQSNQYMDEVEMAHLFDSAFLMVPNFDDTLQFEEAAPMTEGSSLTSWSNSNMAALYEQTQSLVPEGLPNNFVGGAADWHPSHELDLAYAQASVASTSSSGPGYMHHTSPPDIGPVNFQMFDPGMQFLDSPASYQAPLLEYAGQGNMPFPGVHHQASGYIDDSMPHQEYPSSMKSFWSAQ